MAFEKVTYYRRCHMCGHLNENDHTPIERCTHCSKVLARFCFYDERVFEGWPAEQKRPIFQQDSLIQPIYGLTSYW